MGITGPEPLQGSPVSRTGSDHSPQWCCDAGEIYSLVPGWRSGSRMDRYGCCVRLEKKTGCQYPSKRDGLQVTGNHLVERFVCRLPSGHNRNPPVFVIGTPKNIKNQSLLTQRQELADPQGSSRALPPATLPCCTLWILK